MYLELKGLSQDVKKKHEFEFESAENREHAVFVHQSASAAYRFIKNIFENASNGKVFDISEGELKMKLLTHEANELHNLSFVNQHCNNNQV